MNWMVGFLVGLAAPVPGGAGASEAAKSATAGAARPLIVVKRGDSRSIKRAIEEYARLRSTSKTTRHRVTLHALRQGGLAVIFDPPLAPWSLANLVGWLDAPPGIAGVGGARGWLTSPGTGLRYGLQPDPSNPAGDTLLGVNSRGAAVSVYLPEARMCEVRRRIEVEPEPRLDKSASRVGEFEIEDDADDSSGNPRFEVTDPADHLW